MQTVNIEMFKNSTAFSMTLKAWGASAKVKASSFREKITEDQLKRALKVSKILVICDEYDDLRFFLSDTRNTILKRYVVPSFFKRGIDIVKLDVVEQVEKYLNARQAQLPELVGKFQSVFPRAKEGAKARLTKAAEDILGVPGLTFYDEQDYPREDQLPALFGMTWNWIAFGIPDSLPKEVFEAEKARTEKIWQDAQEQITIALRTGWQELVDHMVERLTVDPGDKPKIFKNTLVENMQEFIETFNNRDINNDTQLQALVERAKSVMMGVDPEKLRKDQEARDKILESMRAIKTASDTLITEIPSRRFAFDE